MIIDAHQHFWNLDKVEYPWLIPVYGVLYRTYEANELVPLLKQSGIDKTVVVQAANSYEDTDYMLETAKDNNWICGVVGWVPLHRPDEAATKLEEFRKLSIFKGVRHLIHIEEDKNWIVRNDVIEGLRILAAHKLTLDIPAVYPDHLEHIPTLVEKIPYLKIVIDHLGKPPIKTQKLDAWANQIRSVAESKNVYAKISGLNTAADPENWSADSLKPVIEIAMDAFGPERLMFGSDWPVTNLAGDYLKVWEETNKVLDMFSQAEVDALFGETASRFYNLQ